MANMSYCRFENTLEDFRDCVEAVADGKLDDASEREKRSAAEMLTLAQTYIEEYTYWAENYVPGGDDDY